MKYEIEFCDRKNGATFICEVFRTRTRSAHKNLLLTLDYYLSRGDYSYDVTEIDDKTWDKNVSFVIRASSKFIPECCDGILPSEAVFLIERARNQGMKIPDNMTAELFEDIYNTITYTNDQC